MNQDISNRIRIQVISDIHVEFRDPSKISFLHPCAPILVMAGDICSMGVASDVKKFIIFMKRIHDKYDHIIYVPGNHEFYTNSDAKMPKKTIEQIDAQIREIASKFPKLHYLNNNILELTFQGKLYHFIGSTMWTNIPIEQQEMIQNEMNDYTCIRIEKNAGSTIGKRTALITPADIVGEHKKAIRFIRAAINNASKCKATAIVITHHKPYLSLAKDRMTNNTQLSSLNRRFGSTHKLDPAYETNAIRLIEPPVYAWIYGHTHKHDESVINGVLVVSNPLGYPYERDVHYKPLCI